MNNNVQNSIPQYISGWKTPDDWRATKSILTEHPNAEDWEKAFNEFFRTRLDLRYFKPISILQENGTFQGEGFSIAAIQCSLIEFLESTVQGVRYRYLRRGESSQPYEYSSSSDIFVNFLTQHHPFSDVFSQAIAEDFYIGVRCGLLHEARTKNGWRIWAKDYGGKIINADKKILFRDNFQIALETFIEGYGAELAKNSDYQAAFIRKFDDIINE